MNSKELMGEEALNEVIDNIEIIDKLTLYGRKNIKYYFNRLKQENINKDKKLKSQFKLLTKKDNEIEKYKNENAQLEEILQKYEELVNSMADYIAKNDYTELFCSKPICDNNCIECVICYFND